MALIIYKLGSITLYTFGNLKQTFIWVNIFSRDFIYIDDVVDINIWATKKKFVDIINVGTGISSSFNSVANAIIKNLKKGKIEYINFPKKFEGKYQSFTQASITKLIKCGYKKSLTNIDKGISKYLKILINE